MHEMRAQTAPSSGLAIVEDGERCHFGMLSEPCGDLLRAVGIRGLVEGASASQVSAPRRAPDDAVLRDTISRKYIRNVAIERAPEGGQANVCARLLHQASETCHQVLVQADVGGAPRAVQHAIDVEKDDGAPESEASAGLWPPGPPGPPAAASPLPPGAKAPSINTPGREAEPSHSAELLGGTRGSPPAQGGAAAHKSAAT
eukprot:CAMPEP_0176094980 /NCGR_PEP_ID=MMETSP0120_2-20121206/47601_1 /TAXON_ID=160619 /ORGANISM="Kryptoperidinium foliaceum, Strain CCMP 1326" /LENGTH=200 /DNA_ID=CAMNT_0017428935 /DNA_START=93 /DNA_END=693 /DNA_ORIENTATION=-